MYYFNLKTKFVDFTTGGDLTVFLNNQDAREQDLVDSDRLIMSWVGGQESVAVEINLTDSLVSAGEIGLSLEVKDQLQIQEGAFIKLSLLGIPESVKAIAKQLEGGELSYEEVYSVVADLVSRRLDDVTATFYIASAYWEQNSSKQKMYYLTKAMVETGEHFDFGDDVVDKHSTGGLCGNRITPIMVAIVTSQGVKMPKTSSRAVTSPSGTADTFEVLASVTFNAEEVKEIIRKTNGCVIWGAGGIAPADNRIIDLAQQLPAESFPKMITSIMSKKIAMGAKYLIIDIPVNPTAKVKTLSEAQEIEELFLYLGKRFGIKVQVVSYYSLGPIGRGIGPALEARDILRVMQGKQNRPLDLEKKSVYYSGELLELVGKVENGQGRKIAQEALDSGKAWQQMQKIIKAQKGNPDIDSEAIEIGSVTHDVRAIKEGRIRAINDDSLDWTTKALGAPVIKKAGTYLYKLTGEMVKKGDLLCRFHTTGQSRMDLALQTLKNHQIYEIE